MNMEDHIFRIVVPMEDEIQVKDGKESRKTQGFSGLCHRGDDPYG